MIGRLFCILFGSKLIGFEIHRNRFNRTDNSVNRRRRFSNVLGGFGAWSPENRRSGAVVCCSQKTAPSKPSPPLIAWPKSYIEYIRLYNHHMGRVRGLIIELSLQVSHIEIKTLKWTSVNLSSQSFFILTSSYLHSYLHFKQTQLTKSSSKQIYLCIVHIHFMLTFHAFITLYTRVVNTVQDLGPNNPHGTITSES